MNNTHVIDRLIAFIGFLFLSPLFIVAAAMIWFEDRGPVFFKQTRVGLKGKPFRLLKFRTMKVQNSGPALTVGADQRITKVGRILRKTKLDELPQLINVMKGEMVFVGPRPEVEDFVKLYTSEQQQVLNLTPGITDVASLKYFDESERLAEAKDPHQYYIQTIMPDKIRLNLLYAKSRKSFFTDTKVIVYTLARVLGAGEKTKEFLRTYET